MKSLLPVCFLLLSLTACKESGEKKEPNRMVLADPVEVPVQDGLQRAYFASGCFWCVEAIFESIKGVKEAVSGYAGGHTENPTYEQTNTGTTGHAETVEIFYDPRVVDYTSLVDVYFGSMDPTQKNGQGPDIGSQYRSIAFYQNAEQKKVLEEKIKKLANEYEDPIAVEVLPFQNFWKAEAYHQDYERKNPGDPYIRSVSVPRINRFKEKFPHLLKEDLHH